MATKQMIVAICLMAAVFLAEAGNANFPDVDPKADPDVDLTTVREFIFIVIANE
jgi:hypothetical protein